MTIVLFLFNILLAWICSGLVGYLLFRGQQRHKNPLDWSRVERCLLLMAIWFFIWGIQTLFGGVEECLFTQEIPYYNAKVVGLITPVFHAVFLLWLTLYISGLLLYRTSPESRVFTHIVIQTSAIQTAFVCYLFGQVSDTGSILFAMVQGAFIILLFKPRMGMLWIGTYILLMVISAGAVLLRDLPYAPAMAAAPFGQGRIDPYYFSASLAFQTLVFLLVLLIILFVVAKWKDRERKLSDATDILKKMFGRYLSTEVMNSLLENPAALELGGERRRVTILLTDLRGFTALSERLQPEQVVHILNTYFETIVNIVMAYQGTIIEIMGDSLLVIFGAPQHMPDRTPRAIACAIEIQNAMAEINEHGLSAGLPNLEMGIGLNEADVVVGNIGSSKRSKYAVVGSGVNMASRIESYTVGGQVLCSESVLDAAGDILRIDGQQEVIPKGVDTAVTIYEVGGIAGTYNVYLQQKALPLLTLHHPIPIGYAVLEGKHVGKRHTTGTIQKLSRQGAEITVAGPVHTLNNLEITLQDVDPALASKALYAKVVRCGPDATDPCEVRFTSIPPETAAYLQAHLQYATR